MFLTKPAATEIMHIVEWKGHALTMRPVENVDRIKFSDILHQLQSMMLAKPQGEVRDCILWLEHGYFVTDEERELVEGGGAAEMAGNDVSR